MKTIDTVFFDMGGTLETLACDADLRRESSKLLLQFLRDSNLDPNCSDDTFYETICTGLKGYRQENIGSMKELPALRICSDYVLKSFGFHEDDLREVCDEFMLRLELTFYRREARPEAIQVLTTLAERGYKLGIISNVMSKDCVTTNLTRYGMIDFFDVIVASAVYGRRKPDPRIFEYAAQQIGSLPETCMHVGDKISRDILGAHRAGFGMAVQIIHPVVDEPEPVEPAATAVIEDLRGLLDLVPRLKGLSTRMTPNPNGKRAIFFDAGDILYNRPRRGQHLARFAEAYSLELKKVSNSAELKAMKDKAMIGQLSKREYMGFRLRSMGIDERHRDAAIAALDRDSDDVGFFDGARETLDELKRRGYQLGIITDTYHTKATKLEWLSRNGIDHVWDVFVSSCEEGVRKPHPAIYQAALRQLDLDPSEAAFVGHKRSELDGAKAVGLSTIAFNYEAEAEADDFIEEFCELLTLFPSANGKDCE